MKEQLQTELDFKERDKTPMEGQIIDLVNRATNDTLEKYGLPPLDVSSDHVHLIPHEAYRKLYPDGVEREAKYVPIYQAMFFSDPGPNDRLDFAQTLFHEMIHFKFWNSLQVLDNDARQQTYRTGLATVSRDGRELFMHSLNEAITEDLTQTFFQSTLKDHPLFSADLDAGVRQRGYILEQKRYAELLEQLRDKSGGKYSIQELKEAFTRAAATGRLFPIARLIEKTLGKGAFSEIAGEAESLSKPEPDH